MLTTYHTKNSASKTTQTNKRQQSTAGIPMSCMISVMVLATPSLLVKTCTSLTLWLRPPPPRLDYLQVTSNNPSTLASSLSSHSSMGKEKILLLMQWKHLVLILRRVSIHITTSRFGLKLAQLHPTMRVSRGSHTRETRSLTVWAHYTCRTHATFHWTASACLRFYTRVGKITQSLSSWNKMKGTHFAQLLNNYSKLGTRAEYGLIHTM